MTLPDVYPVRVAGDSPVLLGLTLLDVPDRNPLLPPLYSYEGAHPYHRLRPRDGITYIYLVDPSPKGKAVAAAIANSMEVPAGPIAGLRGLPQLRPGDALLGRSILAKGDPNEDCLQLLGGVDLANNASEYLVALAAAGYTLDDIKKMVDDVIRARDDMIGTKEERVANGGKARFETHWRAEPLKGAPRCYGLNNMVQIPRRVESTPAKLKTFNDTHDSYQKTVHLFVGATTKFNSAAFRLQAPLDLQKASAEYADQVNAPHLGSDDCSQWGPSQLNCADAQKEDEERELEEMGTFGGSHEDENDFGAGHSAGLSLSDLSKKTGSEPGRLHFLGIGVWWKLDCMAQLFFSGLLRHGGTAPLVPNTHVLQGWEIRLNLISYPSTAYITGEAKRPLGSHPFQTLPVHLTPEMTGAPVFSAPGNIWSNYATYAQDGWVGSTPSSHFNFMVRSMYQYSHWIMAQLPQYYGIEIDPDVFVRAFSMLQGDQRVEGRQWLMAPNKDVRNPFGARHKAVQDELLIKQYNRLMQCIPLIKRNKYEGWDVTERAYGARPNDSQSKTKRGIDQVGQTEDVTAKRPRPVELLASHVRSRVTRDLPMTAQKLNYLSSFASGPASGTRSRRVLAARRPTNLPTILEADEESTDNGVRVSRVSPLPRLRRSKRLAPIFESDEEDVESDVSTTMLARPHRRPYSRVAPIISSDEEDTDIDEVVPAKEGAGAVSFVDSDVDMDDGTGTVDVQPVHPPSSSSVDTCAPSSTVAFSSAGQYIPEVSGAIVDLPAASTSSNVSARFDDAQVAAATSSNVTARFDYAQAASSSSKVGRRRPDRSTPVTRSTGSRTFGDSTPTAASADPSTSTHVDTRTRRVHDECFARDISASSRMSQTSSRAPTTRSSVLPAVPAGSHIPSCPAVNAADVPTSSAPQMCSTAPAESETQALPVDSVPRDKTSHNRGLRRQNLLQSMFSRALDDAFAAVAKFNVSAQSNEVLVDALSAMDSLELKYGHGNGSQMSSSDLSSYSTSVQDLKAYCNGTALWINFYRQRVILSEFRVQDQIEEFMEHRCPAILATQSDLDHGDWLVRLVHRVRMLIECGIAVDLNSKDYFMCGAAGNVPFQETSSDLRKRKYLPETERDAMVLVYISRILHVWFGGSSSFSSQAKTALVRVFIDRLGTGCLLLPDVWRVYDELPNYLFDPSCPKFTNANCKSTVFSASHLDDFDMELLQETLCDDTILSRIDALQALYVDMYEVTCAHAEAELARRSTPSSLKKLLVSITSDVHRRRLVKQAEKKAAEEARKNRAAQKSRAAQAPRDNGEGTSTPPHLSADSPAEPSELLRPPSPLSEHQQTARVVKFLGDALVAGNALAQNKPVSSLSKPQRTIFNSGDYFQPIRELGPSRAVMNRGFDLAFAKTSAGFFSIQVFRLIHFNSQAFRKCPPEVRQVQFDDLNEYKAYLTTLRLRFRGKPDSFFCNSAAHGQTVSQRKLHRYGDYWDVSKRNDFTWPPNRSFAVTYQFFKTYDPKITVKVDGEDEIKRLWAGVGDLTRYLLVADMCAAGLVDLPTLEEAANVVAFLNRGAVKGLVKLGFLTEGGTGLLARKAFATFYQAVSEELSEDQKDDFQWNPVTAEHTLCKVSRILKKSFY